jgi:hypothetical protein
MYNSFAADNHWLDGAAHPETRTDYAGCIGWRSFRMSPVAGAF